MLSLSLTLALTFIDIDVDVDNDVDIDIVSRYFTANGFPNREEKFRCDLVIWGK